MLFYVHLYFTYYLANPKYRMLLFPFYREREREKPRLWAVKPWAQGYTARDKAP